MTCIYHLRLIIIEWRFKYIVMPTKDPGCSSAAWRRVWENDGDVTRAKPLCCVVAVSLEPPSAERVRQSVEFSSPGPGLLPSCCAWARPNPRTTALPHLPIITASQIIPNIIQSALCHRNPSLQRGETTERQDFASHCLQAFPFPRRPWEETPALLKPTSPHFWSALFDRCTACVIQCGDTKCGHIPHTLLGPFLPSSPSTPATT